jgi:hypothetical protein
LIGDSDQHNGRAMAEAVEKSIPNLSYDVVTESRVGTDAESRKRRLVDSVLESTMDATAAVHRDNQAFTEPYRAFNRMKLYPGLYESQAELELALEMYAVEVPNQTKRLKEEVRESVDPSILVDGSNTTGGEQKDNADDGTNIHNFFTVASSKSQTDIWGRHPPREAKEPIQCSICGRQVSTLRFAPHLDKCMGIGTTTRGAAGGGNAFLSAKIS